MGKTLGFGWINQAACAVLDVVLAALAAVAVSILWIAVRLAIDPNPARIGADFSGLVVALAVLMMAWIWWPQEGRTWLVSASNRVRGTLVWAAALRRGGVTAWVRAAVAVCVAGLGVYLIRYEAPAPVIELNRAAMAGRSQDEVSYRLTLRYTPAPGEATGFKAVCRVVDGVLRVTFNPQATVNVIHDFSAEMAALAEARDLAGMRVMEAGADQRF